MSEDNTKPPAAAPSPPEPSELAPSVQAEDRSAKPTAAASSTTTASGSDSTDVVLLGPPTADGAGVHVLRAREQRLETGELRNLEEGRPITGEVVTLAPRKDNPRVCDVKESYAPPGLPSPKKKAKGPAQVATQAYRDNWDEVFTRRSRNDVLN